MDSAETPDRKVALDGVPTNVAFDGDQTWVTLRETEPPIAAASEALVRA